MKNKKRNTIYIAAGLLSAFLLWTLAVCTLDVQPIGLQNTMVGLASINHVFHNLTGVHMTMYLLTDWLSLLPLGIASVFALHGLGQWLKRKKLLKVDRSILVLGVFYLVVAAIYFVFEKIIINYRPVFIDGKMEASYPSSTTMLVLCIMPTAAFQFREHIKEGFLKTTVLGLNVIFCGLMVIGRLISGVHWLTDIIGGILLSAGLVMMYYALMKS